jgi:hypothetical protein
MAGAQIAARLLRLSRRQAGADALKLRDRRIQPIPAPLGSSSMAIRPTSGTSKIGIISFAPAAVAFSTRASASLDPPDSNVYAVTNVLNPP